MVVKARELREGPVARFAVPGDGDQQGPRARIALAQRARHLDKIQAPVAVVYGTLETPEFQRQSRDFAEALRKAGKPVELIVAEGYNHFEVMETLANPFQFAGRAALEQMKLKAPV